MEQLTDLPNIGKTLAAKLMAVGIKTEHELKVVGSKNAIIKIATLANSSVCINMLFALEGAIHGIRWHGLDNKTKQELEEFYRTLNR